MRTGTTMRKKTVSKQTRFKSAEKRFYRLILAPVIAFPLRSPFPIFL